MCIRDRCHSTELCAASNSNYGLFAGGLNLNGTVYYAFVNAYDKSLTRRCVSETAKTLSSILPVVMEYNDFEQTYSDEWWEKLKHGTAVYGVFWNAEKENGLGDIDITTIDRCV